MELLIMLILLCDFGLFLAMLATIFLYLTDRNKLGRNAEPQPKPQRKPLFKPKEPPETEEQRRERILLENVENYDGTPKGQQKL